MKKTINITGLALFTFAMLALIGCMRPEIERSNPLDPDGVNYQGGGSGDTYTLTYNGNGASGTPSAVTGLTNGQQITLNNGSGMTKSGYNFAGWTNSAGTTYAGGSSYTMGSADVMLYAKWTVDPFAGVLYRDMITVPGGIFPQTNTDPTGFMHTITGFKMAKYEVTYELWYTVCTWATNNGYTFANSGKEGHDGTAGFQPTAAKYEPVTTVNWRDCMVWCNAYSEMSGLGPVYKTGGGAVIKNSTDGKGAECDAAVPDWNTNGYRLPTEGEWQYAASYKDGSTWTPYNYASGATADYNNAAACQAVAWYSANTSSTKDVGTKATNQLGIHDMSGNVWEWCWDWSAAWPGGSQSDYRGSGSGSSRVLRGGSWFSTAYVLRVGNRSSDSPGSESCDVGFRLARR